MEDNQETWLDQTDLVFVDPVGTGYSRPTKAEYGSEFYQTEGDIEAVTEFIRVYRGRYDAWNSPLFIVGHSYGTTRAMGVAGALERRGITAQRCGAHVWRAHGGPGSALAPSCRRRSRFPG